MLIRAPAAAVFAAFVEPAWLKKFWLKKASGPLAVGQAVQWEFLVPGAREQVKAVRLEPGRHITFNWSDGTTVDIRLARFGRATRVTVEMTGFRGKSAADEAVGATEGFAIVLCDLKALLEQGTSGGMVRDKARLIAAQP
ncbi:hypothetical protein ASD88_10575 [Pelomonas sp. Root662]|nr:hypothetical protein ASC81_10575 [Pelomonas sp. Root405]KRA72207.1 hypothetical protein ASD88_10575 [Pelomonas sp. Root662]